MKTILYNIKRQLVLYIAIIVAVPVAIFSLASYKTRTPSKEKFGVFFAGEVMNREFIGNALLSTFNKYNIKELNFYNDSPKMDPLMFDDYVSSRGVMMCDILIMPISKIDKGFLAYNTLPFKEKIEGQLNYDDVTFGVKLDKSNHDYLEYEYDEDYYVTLSKKSTHYNDYIAKEESLLKDIINWFLTYEKE